MNWYRLEAWAVKGNLRADLRQSISKIVGKMSATCKFSVKKLLQFIVMRFNMPPHVGSKAWTNQQSCFLAMKSIV